MSKDKLYNMLLCILAFGIILVMCYALTMLGGVR